MLRFFSVAKSRNRRKAGIESGVKDEEDKHICIHLISISESTLELQGQTNYLTMTVFNAMNTNNGKI